MGIADRRTVWHKRVVLVASSADTLELIRSEFDALVQQFDVHAMYKQFATSPTNDGSPHVEHYGRTYAYVVTERGEEVERRETNDRDQLLYWLVSDTTREAAQRYELTHRAARRDFRRLLFEKHVELLKGIRAVWGARKRQEYDDVLAKHPYIDGEP